MQVSVVHYSVRGGQGSTSLMLFGTRMNDLQKILDGIVLRTSSDGHAIFQVILNINLAHCIYLFCLSRLTGIAPVMFSRF